MIDFKKKLFLQINITYVYFQLSYTNTIALFFKQQAITGLIFIGWIHNYVDKNLHILIYIG